MANELPTLDPDRESLDTLREHWRETRDRLSSEKEHTAALILRYTTFGDELAAVIAKEQQIQDAISAAEAWALAVDGRLNRIAIKVKGLIHGGKQVDLGNPRHLLYFGNRSVADAIRPILGSQLDMHVFWVEKLFPSETDPGFVALLAPLTAAVEEGEQAKKAVDDAWADNAAFRLTGERRKIFEKYNALAAQTIADLVAYAHAHAELELGSDWAPSFFKHTSRDPGPQTIAEVDDELGPLRARVKKLEAKRLELEEAAAKDAKLLAEAAEALSAYEAAMKVKEQAEQLVREAADRLKNAQKSARRAKKR